MTSVVSPETDSNNSTPPVVAVLLNVIVGFVTDATFGADFVGVPKPVHTCAKPESVA